jgi:iron complex outermembrane recepter protein
MGRSVPSRKVLVCSFALCGSLGYGVALADAASGAATGGAPDSRPAQGDAVELEEVVVTAQKRSERLLEVAAPVTALTATALERVQAVRLDDYAALAPGLNLFGTREGDAQLVVRGITTGSSNSTTTATYIDDSPYGSSTTHALGGSMALDLDPGSLQRIEVLRGPQGTLYGASALGGIVKYVTVAPSLTEFGGRVELDGSSVDGGGQGYGVRGLVSGPLIANTLGFTLSGFDRRDPGYIDNPNLGQRNVNSTRVDGGRAALLWQPSDSFSANLSVLAQDTHGNGSSYEWLNGDLSPTDGGLKQFFFIDQPLVEHSRLYSLTLNDDLGWGALTSISSYQSEKYNEIVDSTTYYSPVVQSILGIDAPNLGTYLPDKVDLNKITQEVRLASPSTNRLEWQGGFFFTHESSDYSQSVDAFNIPNGQPLSLGVDLYNGNDTETYREEAVFGDVTYHFTPQFDVLAGLRYSANQQRDYFPSSGLLAGGTNVAEGTSSDHSVTYLVTPKYKFDDNNMMYARVASGYRPGGPNDTLAALVTQGVPATYQPDTLTNYEIGYKASLLDHTVTLDLSAFDIEWHHIQIGETIGGVFTTGNGSDARSSGFEAAVTWAPVHGLNLTANFAYTDAHLTDNAPGINGVAGDRLPDSPKLAANVGADYDFPLTAQIGGFVGASTHYQGNRVTDFVSTSPPGYERPVLPAYTTVDLRSGVTRGGLEFTLYLKNVGNEHGLNYLTSTMLDGVSPPYAVSVIQPRTVGLSLSQKF